jgi:hypothetical protein
MFRKFLLAGAMVAGFFAAGSLMPSSAEAMPIANPAGIAKTVGGNVDQVAYVCRRVWSRWGGWRRSCYWRPGYYGYRHHYYRPYRYGYRYHRYGYRW